MSLIGLLLMPAIPTTIGVCEAYSAQKERIREAKLYAKFNLVANVRDKGALGRSKKLKKLDGSHVVLLNGKLYLENSIPVPSGYQPPHRFAGYYFPFPLPSKPTQGLVSTIADDPPMLNWIYIDKDTMEVKYGNKSAAQDHVVGSWLWTEDDRALTIDECSTQWVVVEDRETGAWSLLFDREGDWSALPPGKGRILDVELERRVIATAAGA